MGERVGAALLIAFGGPDRMEDVRPFLANVLRGRPVPPARIEEVVRHYEEIGGRSPLTELTFRQAAALQEQLRQAGVALPVHVGMRNWSPYLHETLACLAGEGVRRAVGLILAPHQSEASWTNYQESVAEARGRIGPQAPEVEYTPPWFDHPLFIEAMADRTAEALAQVPEARRERAPLVFTAHSIPVAMAEASPYVEQLTTSARLVARRLGRSAWSIVYQSRSGSPREPWLEPDIGDALRALAAEGATDVVVVPIGFVCDHVEVLWDLDIYARGIATQAGLGFHRAPTANDHPVFVRMMADLVRTCLEA
ncbi:MAG: ferrochelatase [Deltaproteobacteria bacterium]|nr:ferrochelatase [Deltaproteobacteria bacterium]